MHCSALKKQVNTEWQGNSKDCKSHYIHQLFSIYMITVTISVSWDASNGSMTEYGIEHWPVSSIDDFWTETATLVTHLVHKHREYTLSLIPAWWSYWWFSVNILKFWILLIDAILVERHLHNIELVMIHGLHQHRKSIKELTAYEKFNIQVANDSFNIFILHDLYTFWQANTDSVCLKLRAFTHLEHLKRYWPSADCGCTSLFTTTFIGL